MRTIRQRRGADRAPPADPRRRSAPVRRRGLRPHLDPRHRAQTSACCPARSITTFRPSASSSWRFTAKASSTRLSVRGSGREQRRSLECGDARLRGACRSGSSGLLGGPPGGSNLATGAKRRAAATRSAPIAPPTNRVFRTLIDALPRAGTDRCCGLFLLGGMNWLISLVPRASARRAKSPTRWSTCCAAACSPERRASAGRRLIPQHADGFVVPGDPACSYLDAGLQDEVVDAALAAGLAGKSRASMAR